jgi:hypothetical protein
MITVFIVMFVFIAILSYAWVKGISNMKENHPDYKGEEFLNWDRKNDDWDKTHTETEI